MQSERERVVQEAAEWVGTPYHIGQCLKGVAADCAMLLVGVYGNCGVMEIKPEDLGIYPADGHDAVNTQRYLLRLQRHCKELVGVEQPEAGDIVLVKLGKVFNHAAIVLSWPMVVHAGRGGVKKVNALQDPMFLGFEQRFFSPWGKDV